MPRVLSMTFCGGGANRKIPLADPAREQFAAGRDAEMAVKGLDVMVDGVAAEAHELGDLLLAVPGQEGLEGLALAEREAGGGAGGGGGGGLVDPTHLARGQGEEHALAGAGGGGG